jgi:hypothetical protein
VSTNLKGLSDSLPPRQYGIEEVAAWRGDRNRNHAKAGWHFTTENAGIKLKYL